MYEGKWEADFLIEDLLSEDLLSEDLLIEDLLISFKMFLLFHECKKPVEK